MNLPLFSSASKLAILIEAGRDRRELLAGWLRQAGLEPLSFTSMEAARTYLEPRAAAGAPNPGQPPVLIVTGLPQPEPDCPDKTDCEHWLDHPVLNRIPVLKITGRPDAGQPAPDDRDPLSLRSMAWPVDKYCFIAHAQAVLIQRLQEESLRECRNGLPAIFDSIDEPVYVIDPRTFEIILANRALQNLMGPYGNKKCYEYLQDRNSPCDFCTDDKISGNDSGHAYIREFQNQHNQRWYKCIGKAIRWPGGRMVRYEMAVDITGRILAEDALRQSRDLLNATEQIAKVGGWEWDVHSRTMTWTDETYRIHEMEPGEIPQGSEELIRCSLSCYHPENRPVIEAAFRRCITDGTPYSLEFPFTGVRGRQTWIQTMARPLLKDGKTVKVIGNIVDITEHKLDKEALRRSEERFRLAMEATTDGLWDWDVTTGAVDYSNSWKSILELGEVEKTYETWNERIHPDDLEAVRLGLQSCLSGQPERWSQEHRLRTAGGSWKWVLGRGRVVSRDEGGRPLRMIGTMTDISERKAAEEALQESGIRLRKLSRHVPGMIYQFIRRPDGTYGVPFTTEAIEDLFGCRPEDVKNDFSPLARAILPEDFGRVIRSIEESAKQLTLWQCEYRVQLPGQPVRWLSGQASPEQLPDGGIIWHGYHSDITIRKQTEENLKFVSARQQALLSAIPDIVMEVDQNKVYTWANPAGLDFFGPGVIGREAADYFCRPQDTYQIVQPVFEGDEHVVYVESWQRRKDGQERLLAWWCRTLEDGTGKLAGALSTARDITEQRSAEEAIRKNQSMLNLILDTVPQSIFWKDRESRYLGCNRVFANATGLADPGQIIGKTDFDLPWPRQEAEAYRADDREVLEKNQPKRHIIEPLQQADGKRIWIDTSKSPLADESGCPFGVLGIYEDITERKHAELALLESEEKFRRIVESSPLAMYFYRLEAGGRLILYGANPAADRIIGLNHQPLLGKTIEDAFPQLAGTNVPDMYRKIARGELGPQSFEIPYQDERFSGFYDVNVFPTGPGAMAVMFSDISSRKRMEEQLRQAQKMESVGRLAGGVAHDFNNMLGVILGHAEMAMEQLAPANPILRDLQEIHQAAGRSADLTRQLLAFARKQTVAPVVLDLNRTVGGTLQMLRRLIGEDIELTWVPGDALWPVKIDPTQIDQILANLCVNARDAIGDTGRITIETGNSTFDEPFGKEQEGLLPGEYVHVTVSDTGTGMDQAILAHIFEPFFTTKATGKGTGLGLATVYGIVKQNGGFINVFSEPGRGSRFTVYLPRHHGKDGHIREHVSQEFAPAGQETILLVEDEPSILRMTTLMLERMGYTVLAATSPGGSLRLAESHTGPIQLLMSDVVMPEMNGRDLAKNLLKLYPNLKRLFMSGYTADVIAHHGVLDPGVHFIQKPFSMTELAAKIRMVLDQD